MGRKARVYEADFVKKFEDKFYSEFPQVKSGATFLWKDAVKVMRQLGLNPRNGNEYPFYFFTNKVSKGVYKAPTKAALIKGTPEATAASIVKSKQPKIAKTKAKVGRVFASNVVVPKAPKSSIAKTAKSDSDIGTGGFDDSVTYEDVRSLRGEFGIGEFRNNLD
jgi:hypothetical protein